MRKLVVSAVSILLLAPVPALAQGFAVSGHVGTSGLGGGVIVGVTPKLNLRGMFGFFPSEPELNIEDIDWIFDFPTFILATLDFYPMSGFHLSAGALMISDEGRLGAVGTAVGQTLRFGDNTYTLSAEDEIVGFFEMKGFQPYVGIGFGNGIGKKVGLNLDVGVGFGEQPTITAIAQGPLADDLIAGPQFQADVQAELQEIEDEIPSFLKFYPVITLSVSIGFGG